MARLAIRTALLLAAAVLLVLACATGEPQTVSTTSGFSSEGEAQTTQEPSGVANLSTKRTLDERDLLGVSMPCVNHVSAGPDFEVDRDLAAPSELSLRQFADELVYWIEAKPAQLRPNNEEWALAGDMILPTPAEVRGHPVGTDIYLPGDYYQVLPRDSKILIPVVETDGQFGKVLSGRRPMVIGSDNSWYPLSGCQATSLGPSFELYQLATGRQDAAGYSAWLLGVLGFNGEGPATPDYAAVDQIVALKAESPPEPLTWEDLRWFERNISDAPPELRATADAELLLVHIPETWIGSEGMICSRTETGWASCYAFDSRKDGVDDAVSEQLVVPFSVSRQRSEAIMLTYTTETRTSPSDAVVLVVEPELLELGSLFDVKFGATPETTDPANFFRSGDAPIDVSLAGP